jgi:hypothetical protein
VQDIPTPAHHRARQYESEHGAPAAFAGAAAFYPTTFAKMTMGGRRRIDLYYFRGYQRRHRGGVPGKHAPIWRSVSAMMPVIDGRRRRRAAATGDSQAVAALKGTRHHSGHGVRRPAVRLARWITAADLQKSAPACAARRRKAGKSAEISRRIFRFARKPARTSLAS